MLSLIRKPFSGGIHPKAYKELSNDKSIDHGFWPRNVYLNLQLRNGARLKSLVDVGDSISRGQLVAVGRTNMVAPIHSPVNGIVTAITPHITSHPSKMKCETIIIRANQDQSWGVIHPAENMHALNEEELIQRIGDAGIVGLGGAGFPTAAKLRFARQAKVHTLVINGGECEPYLTCDDLTMQTYSAEIISGIKILMKASGAHTAIVGIEDNKVEAFEKMEMAANQEDDILIKMVPSVYPMGSEKHMIKTLTGQAVPPGGLSTQIGILVNNIATARAAYHAVRFQHPLTTRIVTVSGKGVEAPRNVEVPIGTPVNEVIAHCGGLSEDTERLIFGGPMMGQVVSSPQVPIDKTVGGILALTADEMVAESKHQECIRCGQCVRACPMGLMPFQIAAQTRISEFKKADDLGVQSCLSCGACSYVCPSHIPLVQFFMHAKGVINANNLKEKKSAQAKTLTEARKLRLEQDAEAKRLAKEQKAKRPAKGAAPSRPARNQPTTDVASEAAPVRPQRPQRVNKANVTDAPTRPSRPQRPSRVEASIDDKAPSRPARPIRPERPNPAVAAATKPERPVRPSRPSRPTRVEKEDLTEVNHD
jgi:Na+-translocating ferredoxin:NAD+ oxidoreductase subunit C